MAHANWQERRDVNCAALMKILKDLAQADRQCPDARELGRALKTTANMVVTLFDDLRKAGRIDWQVIYCGNGIGKRKWVHLKKEGLSTAKPRPQQRSYIKAPVADTSALAQAKLRLQARGCWVWDAKVSGGPDGLIKVDNALLTPEAVIARAGL